MARIYAVEEGSGIRFLVRIECDGPGCNDSFKPGDSKMQDWEKRGMDHGIGTPKLEWDYCPLCKVRE